MRLLVENISVLAGITDSGKLRFQGSEMARLGTVENAWLLVEDGRFRSFGNMADMPSGGIAADVCVDARGGAVLPS